MEAIFVLSELGTPEAEGGLLGIARDGGMDSEARCAAVWGLGVAGSDRPDLVLEFIADEDDDVALHALAAINHLPDDLIAVCPAQRERVRRLPCFLRGREKPPLVRFSKRHRQTETRGRRL
jgi:hypothetical protein